MTVCRSYDIAFILLVFGIPIVAIVNKHAVIKRLHDLGLSRRATRSKFTFWVPGYEIHMEQRLLFERGTVGPNKYGPDPLKEERGA